MNKLLRSISILAIVCFSSPIFGQIDVTSSPAFENNANGTINISLSDAGPYDVTVLDDEGVLVCSFQSVESGSLERCIDIHAGTYTVSIMDRNNCESTYSIEVLTEACYPLPGKCLSWQVLLMSVE